jgi:hypothetical protein
MADVRPMSRAADVTESSGPCGVAQCRSARLPAVIRARIPALRREPLDWFRCGEHVGDLAVTALVEVEQHQRAIEQGEDRDETAKRPHLHFHRRVAAVFVGDIVQLLVERHVVAAAMASASRVRDRHVQRDAVHPRRERPLAVESGKCPPQLRGDLLREIVAIVGLPGIGAGHLEHDAAVAL